MITCVHVLCCYYPLHIYSVPDGTGKTPHFCISCSLAIEASSKMQKATSCQRRLGLSGLELHGTHVVHIRLFMTRYMLLLENSFCSSKEYYYTYINQLVQQKLKHSLIKYIFPLCGSIFSTSGCLATIVYSEDQFNQCCYLRIHCSGSDLFIPSLN